MLISEIWAFPVSIGHPFNARLIRYSFPWQKKPCLIFTKFLCFDKDCVNTASIVTAAHLSLVECIVFPVDHFPSIINIRSHHEESLDILLPLTFSCQCLGVATFSRHESSYFLTIQPHALGMLCGILRFLFICRTFMKKCQRSAGSVVASGLTGVSPF